MMQFISTYCAVSFVVFSFKKLMFGQLLQMLRVSQNATAYPITGATRYQCTTPVLSSLHWLSGFAADYFQDDSHHVWVSPWSGTAVPHNDIIWYWTPSPAICQYSSSPHSVDEDKLWRVQFHCFWSRHLEWLAMICSQQTYCSPLWGID